MNLNKFLNTAAFSLGLACLSGIASAADVSVEGAYARAVPPTAENSAAFMKLVNRGDKDVALVGASSSVSGTAELHNHIHDNGVMRMRQVSEIVIPAGGSVELMPGSYHVMLIGLKQPLKPGDPVALTLKFNDGDTQKVDLQAQKIKMAMPMQHMNMDHQQMNH